MKNHIFDIKRHLMEIKIGSFLLVAILILFFSLLSIREFSFFKGYYRIKVKFEFAEGLRISSPIRFCGVDVGEVEKINLVEEDSKPIVVVTAKIDRGTNLPQNSYFFINSLSLLGEKYLEVSPPPQVTEYLREGAVVNGISPVPMFTVVASFNKTMKEVSDFVKEGKVKTSFENTLANLESLTTELKRLSQGLNSKEGTVGRLIYDDTLYVKAVEFAEDIKKNPWKLLHKPKGAK